MTHITESTYVKCPPGRAQTYLFEYVRRLRVAGNGRAILRLGAGTRQEGLRLEHDVDAELKPSHDPSGLEYRVDISWSPERTTLLPSFTGVFRLQWDEEYGNSRLVIDGDYVPPLGAAGKAFDAVAGRRIAEGTLRALLEDLRSAIEGDYARDVNKA